MKRAIVLGALLALAGVASAQNVAGHVYGMVRLLKDRELLPKVPQVSPMQPRSGETIERTGQLPPIDETAQYPDTWIIDKGNIAKEGTKIVAKGPEGVHMYYRGWEVFADEIHGDELTRVFVATGHVKVFGKDAFIKGDKVTVNFRNESFLAEDSYVDARPSILGGGIQRDLYMKGGQTYGNKYEIFGEKCDVTSCSYEFPHYHLKSAKVVIRPGKRAIFRKVDFIVLNKVIFKLPYLSIPLDERTYRYMPEVGQTFDEGYYVKFKFGIPLKGDYNFLDTHVDYYTKKGPGLGFDYGYTGINSRGIVSAYSVLGSDKTFTITTRHRSDFRFGTLTLDTNYQQNNYLAAPDASIFGMRFGFLVPQGRGTATRFSVLYNDNNSGGSRTQAQAFTLNDTRRWSDAFKTTLDLGFSKSANTSGTFSSEREQLDVKFKAEQDLRQATANLEYQRLIPVGDTTNFFSSSDRTPVLSLRTDSRRLFGRRSSFGYPFQAEFSVGEFANSLNQDRVTRTNLDININRPDNSQRRLKLDVNARFKQGVYSDDTAQYTLGLGLLASYSLGYDTSLNVRYNYLRPYGFSPLQIDRLGKNNLLSADLSFRPYRTLLLGAQTGYDMLQLEQKGTPWQTLGVRMEYRPVDYISMRSLATYDTFQRAWNNLRIDVAYKPGATFVGLGAKYDGIRKVWSQMSGFVDGFKWGRLRTSVMFDYNGYLQRFEARHFQFTYDLHCWEAVLTIIDNPVGFRSGTSINFMFRIKAFPFDTNFGVGTSGQPIGLGGSRGY